MGAVSISPSCPPDVRDAVLKHMDIGCKRQRVNDTASRPDMVDTAPACTGCKNYMAPPAFHRGLGVCNAVTFKHRVLGIMPCGVEDARINKCRGLLYQTELSLWQRIKKLWS